MIRFGIGIVALFIALVASLMLVIQHLGGMSLPGCGPGSACAQAAASAWGAVPGLDWPTSFVGLAHFAAMLAAWIWTGGSLRAVLTGIAIVGGLVSIALTVAMFSGDYVCLYCLAVHAGNVLFVAMVIPAMFGSYVEPENDAKGRATVRSDFAPFAIAVVLVTASLFALERVVSAEAAAKDERELGETSAALAGNTAGQAFTGRHLTGPANAPIRLVVFSDYQCRDCKRIEGEISQLLAERQNISFSAKHFPMSSKCNPYMKEDMHGNACWAARAAEAAGILRGSDGFWQMHHWLFNRGGGFTDAELHAGLQELGYDVNQFIKVMSGPETLARVQADIEEAVGLGIHYTPMIFINGVELKGWNAPNAVRRMVEQVAATNPVTAPPTADQPPSAIEKYIADWKEEPVRQIPAAPMSWPMGAEDAAVRIVMWGDLQEPFCARADSQIRAYMQRHGDVRYEFRTNPFDKSCNAVVSNTIIPYGCVAARAALAAGQLGGNNAYWAMHKWLMGHQIPLDDNALADAAAAAGVDRESLIVMMNSAEVTDAITQNIYAARMAGLRSIPMIVVNERWVPRWTRDNEPDLLDRILDAAREMK